MAGLPGGNLPLFGYFCLHRQPILGRRNIDFLNRAPYNKTFKLCFIVAMKEKKLAVAGAQKRWYPKA